jgi:hypothetical protein
LHFYRTDGSVPTNGLSTFTVPLEEDKWQNNNGNEADRAHMLMTLADITAIYIKATYTTIAEEAALVDVSMETASRSGGSGVRAWPVEECSCPQGHQGLSCEDCQPGYYKSESGIYLGICERCECNGHADECDSKTGKCLVRFFK